MRLRAATILLSLMAAGCTGGAAADLTSRPGGLVPAEELVAEPPTTEAAPTTSTPPVTEPPLPGLGVGASGPEVAALEQKLEALHYYVGTADGSYDGDTRDAVLAFQKVTGMDRTGRATDDVVAAITTATPVNAATAALIPAGGLKRVEVDLDRQVLFLYEANNVKVILNVSTGSNERFCSEGWCRRAVTPTGSFRIYDKRSGWETGPLGSLYNAQYFNGAIAIHGSRSVPAYPASHGCVRISMNAAEWMPDELTAGTPVYVVAADEPRPAPLSAATSVTSTPTTIVPDTGSTTRTTAVAPTTSTTAPNLLNQLLAPPTTRRL